MKTQWPHAFYAKNKTQKENSRRVNMTKYMRICMVLMDQMHTFVYGPI